MLFFGTTVDGIQMGLCFAIIALGMYISFTILDFPDLSVDGTFPLGGVVSTVLMLRLGVPPLAAILLAFIVGAAAGAITGTLHVKFGISKILSGIIVMTALMSVNLSLTRFLSKNGYTITIFSYGSEGLTGIFNGKLSELFGVQNRDYMVILMLLVIVIILKLLVDIFMKTKLGFMLRATGANEKVVTSLGKNVGYYKILGIAVSNGLVAVAGAVYSQLFRSYDNTSGSGKVVLALASVIIGMAVFSNIRFFKDTTSVIFGAVIYSLCLNYLVLIDKNGIYLKLLNALLFAIILIFNDKISALFKKSRAKREGSV